MYNQTFIRNFYSPLQPTESSRGDTLLFYKEYEPCNELQSLVYCFWELKTSRPITDTYLYNIVTDGCTDLMFDCKSSGLPILIGASYKAYQSAISRDIHYFGIKFFPGCLRFFIDIPLHEIAGKLLKAKNILKKDISDLSLQIFEQTTIEERIKKAESFLLQQLQYNQTNIHPAFQQALYTILVNKGNINSLNEISKDITGRHLRRLFLQYIGFCPKLFSRIIRFQNVLSVILQQNQPLYKFVFNDYGFFDQSHFIREFKEFYGSTPGNQKLGITNIKWIEE